MGSCTIHRVWWWAFCVQSESITLSNISFLYMMLHITQARGSERVWIMQEFVHTVYCCCIDESTSGREIGEPWVRYELKYKKSKMRKRQSIMQSDEYFLQQLRHFCKMIYKNMGKHYIINNYPAAKYYFFVRSDWCVVHMLRYFCIQKEW